jgi:hypothetical protein
MGIGLASNVFMSTVTQGLTERVGSTLGWLAAPLFALTSRLRRARTFHPSGEVFIADVTPEDGAGVLGERLRGPALVRVSGALWKGDRERLDVLGVAVRLRRTREPSADPSADDQDLLFATIRSPWAVPFAPFTTDVHDFLANDYFALSPFDVPGFGRAYLRLRPSGPSGGPPDASRLERLRAAVARGDATLRLEVRAARDDQWKEVAVIALREPAPLDQEHLRRGVYTVSQRGRARHAG